jgi:peptidyl-tRNA hydrolase
MADLAQKLSGGDLRSIGEANGIATQIHSQSEFDELFKNLFRADRLVVMRAADAIEKVTAGKPEFLKSHNVEILQLLKSAENKELKWHLAQLAARLELHNGEIATVVNVLKNWALDTRESRIVRVNSLQALFDIAQRNDSAREVFKNVAEKLHAENIPSITARLKKLKL